MEEKNIREYARLMDELGLTALQFGPDGSVTRIEREGVTVQAAPAPAAPAAPAPREPEIMASAGDYRVCSPMVGVFYAAPAENAPPFVKAGDPVRRGDVLCMIEAMKLMNEIVAEEDGIVERVCAENGQVVDFGRELFIMRR